MKYSYSLCQMSPAVFRSVDIFFRHQLTARKLAGQFMKSSAPTNLQHATILSTLPLSSHKSQIAPTFLET